MILQTEAVVLHTRRFRDSSKIVTLYTREHGKMSVIARGVMQQKSKFGSVLQPMAWLSTVIYRKEGRDLQNLSAAEPVRRFGRIQDSLDRMSAGLAIVELVSATIHDEDKSETLFQLLVDALTALNAEACSPQNVALWFMIRLAGNLGYAPRVLRCGSCGEETAIRNGEIAYSVALGAPLCNEHFGSSPHHNISAETYALLEQLGTVAAMESANMPANSVAQTGLRELLTGFLRFHVEGLKRLSVGSVTSKILGGALVEM